MSDAQLVEYYTNLLIIQYNSKARAAGQVEAYASAATIYDLALEVVYGYDVETAAGVQLDVIGAFVGIARNALGTPFDDDYYRALIKLAIFKNYSNGSLADIDALSETLFAEIPFRLVDDGSMGLSYLFEDKDEAFVTDALSLGLIPKPAGVGLVVAFTEDLDLVFGYADYDEPVPGTLGYGTYELPGTGGWLSYDG